MAASFFPDGEPFLTGIVPYHSKALFPEPLNLLDPDVLLEVDVATSTASSLSEPGHAWHKSYLPQIAGIVDMAQNLPTHRESVDLWPASTAKWQARALLGLVFCLLLLVMALPRFARGASSKLPTSERVSIPRIDGELRVDGRLDETQWKEAARITGYHPWEPVEEGELPGRTEAFVFYNAKMIYFGFRCQTNNPSEIRAHLAPREDINFDDQVGIYLDTYNDDRQAFVFYINALGIQQDLRLIDGVGANESWDTVYHSKGIVGGEGYVVEVGIPFRSLRFPNAPSQEWGLILTRKFGAQGSKAVWPEVTHNISSFVGQASTITGLEGISSGSNIEIQPTLVTQWGDAASTSEEQLIAPLALEAENGLSVAPGLSVKYGLTSNLTLDATINPDFSQVESDPGQLDANQRRALYYSERRPFFLEGAETLSGAPYLSLHSRTIVSPLWGLKVTGKQGKTSVGVLTAYDTQPQPSFSVTHKPYTPGLEPEELEGRGAMVSVARVAQDIGDGSVVGGTLVDKEILDMEEGKAYGYHHFGIVDGRFRVGQHNRVTASLEYSQTGQREGDRIWGSGYFLGYSHSRRLFYFQINHGYEPPTFRAEAAYLPLTGVMFTDMYTQYQIEPSTPAIVLIQPNLFLNYFRAPDNLDYEDVEIKPGLYMRFAGQTYFSVNYSHRWEYYYRGTLPGDTFPRDQVQIRLWSDRFQQFSWYLGLTEGGRVNYWESELGYATTPYVSMTLRPSSWLNIGLEYQRQYFLQDARVSPLYVLDLLQNKDTSEEVYDQSVLRGNINLLFSPEWSLRAIGQMTGFAATETDYISEIDHTNLTGSVLLTYLPHPGTAAYLGFSRGMVWDYGDRIDDESSWRVFFKLSYLWRI